MKLVNNMVLPHYTITTIYPTMYTIRTHSNNINKRQAAAAGSLRRQ